MFYLQELLPYPHSKHHRKIPSDFQQGKERKEALWNMPASSVCLYRIYPQEKLFNQSLSYLWWGKYTAPAPSSHSVTSEEKNWEALVKFTVQGIDSTKTETSYRTVEHSSSPTPYHDITKVLFTEVPFTQHIMFAIKKLCFQSMLKGKKVIRYGRNIGISRLEM